MGKLSASGLLAIVLLLPAFLCGNAMAQEKKVVELKLGNTAPDSDPMNRGVEKFAELVKTRTNGSVIVKTYFNGQLGNLVQQVESVKMGAQDIFNDQLTWFQEMDGMSGLRYFALPSGFSSHEQAQKFMKSKMGQDLVDTLRTRHGIRLLAVNWNRPARQVLSKRPIRSLEDLKGLKIRVPEQELWVGAWKAQGANPTPIAWPELYTGLQQGIVEALEAPAAVLYANKMHEQAKFLTYTNHSVALVTLAMNERRFQSLTPEQQKILLAAAEEGGEENNRVNAIAEKEVVDKFRKEGVTVIELKDHAAFWKPQDAFVLEMENKGKWPKGMMQEVNKIR